MEYHAVDGDDPISRLTARERDALGIPSRKPDILRTSDGFAMWWAQVGEDIGTELPTTRPGLVSQSSVTGTGLGRVQTALAYLRPDTTYLVVAHETHESGYVLFAAEAEDLRAANALLASIEDDWRMIGWRVTAVFAGADEPWSEGASVPAADAQAAGLLRERAPDARVIIDLAAYRRDRTRVYLA
jgi:hypothetical protein